MAKEIERKFLVDDTSFLPMAIGKHEICQGYLSRKPTVRVRTLDTRAFITVKSRNLGATRSEWEYEVPLSDAREMMHLCTEDLIEKTRYLVPYGGRTWEVDVFHGGLEGLIVAEVELPEENADVELPPFAGREVTGNPAFYNSVLSEKKQTATPDNPSA